MRLLTFDTGDASAGPRVGLAHDSGIVDLTARLGIGSLRQLIAEESAKNGRPTPVSDVLVDLTRRIHAGELQPDQTNLGLVRQQLGD